MRLGKNEESGGTNIIQYKNNIMPEVKHLEVVVMPNGEIICLGKTIGWVKEFREYLSEPEKK